MHLTPSPIYLSFSFFPSSEVAAHLFKCRNGLYMSAIMHVCDYMSVIQKISSICEYWRCSAAVTIVHMCAEFIDSVARHGRNLQTFEQCLRIVLCVYNV